jgi:hypothetical protein
VEHLGCRRVPERVRADRRQPCSPAREPHDPRHRARADRARRREDPQEQRPLLNPWAAAQIADDRLADLVRPAAELFDLFAVHLYDDPRRIPDRVRTVRGMMRADGYERPVVVGEYNGPTLFQLPEAETALHQTMASAFADAGAHAAAGGDLSTEGLTASAAIETPERRAMKELFGRMPELPPRLQMLMEGCTPELEERRHRINCPEIVSRNLFAYSTGVRRTVCWHLAPEVAHFEDPFTMMELLQGKLLLVRHDDGGQLTRYEPAGHTFRRLAEHVAGAHSVSRIALEQHPEVFAFTVERHDRAPLVVLWQDGDLFSGEDEPPTLVEWPWPHDHAVALDALGDEHAFELRHGRLTVRVSVTPVFLIAPFRPRGPTPPNMKRGARPRLGPDPVNADRTGHTVDA